MFVETISPAEAAKRLSDPLVHFAGHDAASEPSTSQSSNGGTPSEAREAARALFNVPFVGRLLRRLFRKREEGSEGGG